MNLNIMKKYPFYFWFYLAGGLLSCITGIHFAYIGKYSHTLIDALCALFAALMSCRIWIEVTNNRQ